MNRFDAMSTFVAVCDAGGFAAAGRRLGISASVVTRLVAALEGHLGVRLLQRTTRALHLTDAGLRYLERARRVLAELDEAEMMAQQENAEPSGLLSISAPVLFGRIHVAPLLGSFMERFPRISADLRLSDSFVNLVDEGFDLAVRIGNLPDSQLVAQRVGQTQRIVVASPDYLRRMGCPTHPQDLNRLDIINFSAMAANTEWRFERDAKVRLIPRLNTNSGDAAIAFAKSGAGVTRVLCYQVHDALADGSLVQILQDYAPPPFPVQLVFPSNRLLSVKVRTFVEYVRTHARWSLDLHGVDR